MHGSWPPIWSLLVTLVFLMRFYRVSGTGDDSNTLSTQLSTLSGARKIQMTTINNWLPSLSEHVTPHLACPSTPVPVPSLLNGHLDSTNTGELQHVCCSSVGAAYQQQEVQTFGLQSRHKVDTLLTTTWEGASTHTFNIRTKYVVKYDGALPKGIVKRSSILFVSPETFKELSVLYLGDVGCRSLSEVFRAVKGCCVLGSQALTVVKECCVLGSEALTAVKGCCVLGSQALTAVKGSCCVLGNESFTAVKECCVLGSQALTGVKGCCVLSIPPKKISRAGKMGQIPELNASRNRINNMGQNASSYIERKKHFQGFESFRTFVTKSQTEETLSFSVNQVHIDSIVYTAAPVTMEVLEQKTVYSKGEYDPGSFTRLQQGHYCSVCGAAVKCISSGGMPVSFISNGGTAASFNSNGGTVASFISNGGTAASFISNGGTASSFISNGGTVASFISNGGTASSFISNGGTASSFISNGGTVASFISNGGTAASFISSGGTASSFISNGGTVASFISNGGTAASFISNGGTAASFISNGGTVASYISNGGTTANSVINNGNLGQISATCTRSLHFPEPLTRRTTAWYYFPRENHVRKGTSDHLLESTNAAQASLLTLTTPPDVIPVPSTKYSGVSGHKSAPSNGAMLISVILDYTAARAAPRTTRSRPPSHFPEPKTYFRYNMGTKFAMRAPDYITLESSLRSFPDVTFGHSELHTPMTASWVHLTNRCKK
ncbi:uncharacterized protein [Procambarus clarkii]|uniref:uncharacterized protein isoform X2 n=1 Tax=Procambarus clarkii TaxID=6728 RepID=UPI0037421DC9